MFVLTSLLGDLKSTIKTALYFSSQIQTFIKDLTEITNEIKRQETATVPNKELLGVKPISLQ